MKLATRASRSSQEACAARSSRTSTHDAQGCGVVKGIQSTEMASLASTSGHTGWLIVVKAPMGVGVRRRWASCAPSRASRLRGRETDDPLDLASRGLRRAKQGTPRPNTTPVLARISRTGSAPDGPAIARGFAESPILNYSLIARATARRRTRVDKERVLVLAQADAVFYLRIGRRDWCRV